MRRASKKTNNQSLQTLPDSTVHRPEDRRANRAERLTELLRNATAFENGLTLPDVPGRYVALEQSAFGDTLWAYFDDLMTGIIEQLEASDTSFIEQIRVHDLDTDSIYAPKWTIESLYEIPHSMTPTPRGLTAS